MFSGEWCSEKSFHLLNTEQNTLYRRSNATKFHSIKPYLNMFGQFQCVAIPDADMCIVRVPIVVS